MSKKVVSVNDKVPFLNGKLIEAKGIVPSGTKNITDIALTDVTNYATAQVVDADLVAENIKKDVNILGVVGSFEGGGSSPVPIYYGEKIITNPNTQNAVTHNLSLSAYIGIAWRPFPVGSTPSNAMMSMVGYGLPSIISTLFTTEALRRIGYRVGNNSEPANSDYNNGVTSDSFVLSNAAPASAGTWKWIIVDLSSFVLGVE